MQYVKPCCNKVDGYFQDEMGHWHKTGTIGGQLVRSQRHAENMAMTRALRTATQKGYLKPYGNTFKYKG